MIEPGTRLVFQSEIKTFNTNIPAGIICTLISSNNDSNIVKYGIDEETKNPKIIAVPSPNLRIANNDDLKTASPHRLLPFHQRVGYKLRVSINVMERLRQGDIVEIIGIEIKEHEKNDIFFVENLKNKERFEFEKAFVDAYFEQYNEEFEAQLGKEIIQTDMSKLQKNYYLEGARMIVGSYEESKVVFIVSKLEEELYEVEDIYGVRSQIEKIKLMPISNVQTLYKIPREKLIPKSVSSGKMLIANKKVEQNFLLKNKFKENDKIIIMSYDSIGVNIFEDLYQVDIDNGNQFKLSYAEIKNYFSPIENLEEEKRKVIYTDPNFEDKLKKALGQEAEDIVEIHELSINGFKFKINNDNFTIEQKEFNKDDIDVLIRTLNKLKNMF